MSLTDKAREICGQYFRRGNWRTCCQGCPIACTVGQRETLAGWVERINDAAEAV